MWQDSLRGTPVIATIKIILIRIIAVAATLFAAGMFYWGYPFLRGVFLLTDPTGMFGTMFIILGFLSNLFTIFAFGVFVRHAIASHSWRERMPVAFKVIFLLKAFEALNVLPCLSDQPGELCGASVIFVSYLSSPIIVAAGGKIIFGTADVVVRRTGKAMLLLILLAGFAGWVLVTPKNARECALMHDLNERAVCAERFALGNGDIAICRDIDYRTVKYDCMQRVAQMKRKPELCEEIQPPTDTRILPFETKPAVFRDNCYYGLAFSLRDNSLCSKISDSKMRTTCSGSAGVSPRGPDADLPTGIQGANDGNGLPPQ